MKSNSPVPAPQAWWSIWIALLGGLPFFWVYLGNTSSRSEGLPLATFIPIVAGAISGSVILRWVVLPRLTDPQKAFPIFVAGMALAESIAFYGLFLAPAYKVHCFVLSALGMFQFIPLFAGKYTNAPKQFE